MGWNTDELKTRFSLPENTSVIDYLERVSPHAHSDLGTAMFEAAQGNGKLLYYGPNPTNCSYVFLHTPEGVIYSLAEGMTTLSFRLPLSEISNATAEGATVYPELGENWVSFNPFIASEPTAKTRARMKRWCECAYNHALDRQRSNYGPKSLGQD